MNRIKGQCIRRYIGRSQTAIGTNLPLIIPNQSQLQQPTEIFLQWKNLSKAPLDRKSLSRSGRGSPGGRLTSVKLPIGEKIGACPLVLCQVKGSTCCEVIAPIS